MDHLVAAFLEPLLAVLGAIFEVLFAGVVHFLLGCLLYLVAVPFCCVFFTPVVLIRALFGSGRYTDEVAAGYRGICAGIVHAACWV